MEAQDIGECTITINGQTVFVGPFGSRYRATNIPAGSDWVRACIICTRDDGTVLYGQTDYFEIVDSQTFVMIDDFSLSPSPPSMIRSLRTTPGTDVVQGLGQTTQMMTMATLSDDTQVDVSQRIRGTTYRTSNAEIATISRNGLVTGLRTGIALITATNEGVTSVARVIVTEADEPTSVEGFVQDQDGNPVAGAIVTIPEFGFQTTTDEMGRFTIPGVPSSLFGNLSVNVRLTPSGGTPLFGRASGLEPMKGGLTDVGFVTLNSLGTVDSDDDGVNDDVELAIGLNPNDEDSDGDGILDGDEDFDSDGLSDAGEFIMGTDSIMEDTDGDGILDGEEDADFDELTDSFEIQRRLNPFLVDSDGDGWDDTTEFAEGLNALNPESVPIVQVTSLSVSYVNAFEDSPPAGLSLSISSLPASYLNANPVNLPDDQPLFLTSLPVSFLNSISLNLPGNTPLFSGSLIVSYLNNTAQEIVTKEKEEGKE